MSAAPAPTPAPEPPHPAVTIPELPVDWRHHVVTGNAAGLVANGWAVAESRAVPAGGLDPEVPAVVGIDLDLSGRAAGDLIALVAMSPAPRTSWPTPRPRPSPSATRSGSRQARTASRCGS